MVIKKFVLNKNGYATVEQTEYFFGSEKIITDVGTIKIFLGKIL